LVGLVRGRGSRRCGLRIIRKEQKGRLTASMEGDFEFVGAGSGELAEHSVLSRVLGETSLSG
jgi:hypothetical protein